MSYVFDSIMTGLQEAVQDARGQESKLEKRVVTILPVKKYSSDDVRHIRQSVGMTQSVFAGYLGVSVKTVEAWEAGTNHPCGAASRLLNMLELKKEKVVEEFPFVTSTIN